MVFRGIPLIVLLYLMYFFITDVLIFGSAAIQIEFLKTYSAELTIFLTLLIITSIRAADSYLSSLYSIEKSQIEAAQSLNFSTTKIIFRLLLPQANVIVTPMLGNLIIGVIKGTSLISIIGVGEILLATLQVADTSYSYLEAYTSAAIIYWMLAIVVELIIDRIELFYIRKYGGKLY